jgi:hypothetical protein
VTQEKAEALASSQCLRPDRTREVSKAIDARRSPAYNPYPIHMATTLALHRFYPEAFAENQCHPIVYVHANRRLRIHSQLAQVTVDA